MGYKKGFNPKSFQKHTKKRVIERRTNLRYYLIVSEGEKTEPYYFEGFKKHLPPHLLDLIAIDIEGIGQNTLQIVEKGQQYQGFLERELSKRMGTPFIYEKNGSNMYEILQKHGNQEQAIVWAKRLKKNFQDGNFAEHNPSTTVYSLIESIRDFIF